MIHNHVTRDIKPPGVCAACDQAVGREVRKYAVQRFVSADEVRRTTAVDLLAWSEEKVLTELVRATYRSGYVGQHWPVLERIPQRNHEDTTEDDPLLDGWLIRAWVWAVPR